MYILHWFLIVTKYNSSLFYPILITYIPWFYYLLNIILFALRHFTNLNEIQIYSWRNLMFILSFNYANLFKLFLQSFTILFILKFLWKWRCCNKILYLIILFLICLFKSFIIFLYLFDNFISIWANILIDFK